MVPGHACEMWSESTTWSLEVEFLSYYEVPTVNTDRERVRPPVLPSKLRILIMRVHQELYLFMSVYREVYTEICFRLLMYTNLSAYECAQKL
jgi:hypothetical protein